MLESVIVLRDALYELPGGFKDTARVYREDLAGAAPTSVEYGSDAPLLLSVPQGITGAWQAGPRNEATFENGERQAIELGYARNASLGEDVRVFGSTFGAMFGKRKTGR